MDYGALLDNVGWSAFYLIRGGAVVEEAAARCPWTMAALADVPLTDAPGRTPAVLFSLLPSWSENSLRTPATPTPD